MRPFYLDFSPQSGFIGTALDAHIFFRVECDETLDLSTFEVKINNVYAILGGLYQTGFTGIITNEDHFPKVISVVIIPDIHFLYNQLVNVAFQITNVISEYGADHYSFLTIPDPDVDGPIVTANPHGKLYNSSQTVALLSNELSITTIFYTLDGSTPTLLTDIYSSQLLVSEGKTTLKFIGVNQQNNVSSDIITEIYEVDSIAPVSIATPPGGNYFSSQQIILSSNDPTAVIHYTVNGLTPDLTSPIYTTPIQIKNNKTTKIRYFAIDRAGNQEIFHSDIYTIEIAKNNYVPTNIFVTCPFDRNSLYIRWDDMWPIFNGVIGYNVYRADIEMGPYQKLNDKLLGVTQYLDKTLDVKIINEDVSEQFRRTVNISRDVNEDFSKVGEFDRTKWKETDPGELLFQNEGAIFKDSTGLRQTSKLTSVFKLRGNFEIKVKFFLTTWISPGSKIQSCKFAVKKNDFDFVEVSRDKSHLLDLYCSNQYVNGNPELPITVVTSDVYGEFKIIRVGEIVTTYFYDRVSETYIQVASYDNYTEDLYVEMSGTSEDKQVEIKFNDFIVVSGNPIIIEPLNQRKEYWIYCSKRPIVDSTGLNIPTDKINEVSVTINGNNAFIAQVQGVEGLIQLQTDKIYDEVKREWFEPITPDEFSTVLVTYKIPKQTTNITLRKVYFYKVTCVTNEDETDIDLVSPESLKPEKMTYIFEEAVRRNSWMLDQAGERVLLYIKKKAGKICHCTYRDIKLRTHKSPDQDCETCFGSGFVGGYDGPYPVIIAPLTTEQRVQQTDRGLRLSYQIETWLGPTPIIKQRDMIIRRNGDRCSIGPITPVEGPGGVMVQQHFVIEILDGTDIRYKFKIQLPDRFSQPGIDKTSKHILNGYPNVAAIDSPKEREELFTSEDKISHQDNNVDHVVKGRNIVTENTLY
jgi:hypothetical protein